MAHQPVPAKPSARKPGRKPLGQQPLTGAQRQARYRRRHPAAPVFAIAGQPIAAPGHSDGATP
jgi:hypothetical protein